MMLDGEALPVWLAPLLAQGPVTPAQYCASAPPQHRRRLGQFFTPPHVAAWMADYVVGPDTYSALDPAVGTGVLAEALLGHPRLPAASRLTAYDRDPAMVAIAGHNLAASARFQPILGDFLELPADSPRYDAIICNPPYLRHRVLHQRHTLVPALAARFDLPLSSFSNSYVLFMLQIAALLSAHGRAAIITPVDYLNANFGRPIKQFLLRANLIDGLLLFDQSSLVFAEANIAACVLLLRADRAADEPLTLAHVADETQLRPLAELPPESLTRHIPSELRAEQPWLPLFPGAQAGPIAPALLTDRRLVPLGQLAAVRRGIATGANEFFTLTVAERVRLGLEPDETRPCLVKATAAPLLRFDAADLAQMLDGDGKVLLLDLPADPSPAARRYLEHGQRLGVDQRYLPRQRRPWYSAEQRLAAPLLVTTFSRRGFRFVLNDAGIVNLTAFHCIYPHALARDDLLVLASFLNAASGGEALRQRQRVYGSGLHKLEPLDVALLQVPDPHGLPRTLHRELVQLYQARCAAQRHDPGEEQRLAQAIDRLWAAYLAGAAARRALQGER